MKKYLLALFLVLAMVVPAFATWPDPDPSPTATATISNSGNSTATGGAGGSAVINDNSRTTNNNANLNTNLNSNINRNENHNTNFNTNLNTNRQSQGQNQGQLQGQGQGQSQFGYVNIETPQGLLAPPSQTIPELGFGQGRMNWNFARELPKVAIPLYSPNETVVRVLDTTANVKAKNLLPTLLDMVADQQPLSISDRLIIIRAEAQKSWNTGGNAGGAGSYLPTSGLAGASGAGSIVPSWGGTKADDLYTIIIVRVAL